MCAYITAVAGSHFHDILPLWLSYFLYPPDPNRAGNAISYLPLLRSRVYYMDQTYPILLDRVIYFGKVRLEEGLMTISSVTTLNFVIFTPIW